MIMKLSLLFLKNIDDLMSGPRQFIICLKMNIDDEFEVQSLWWFKKKMFVETTSKVRVDLIRGIIVQSGNDVLLSLKLR